MARVGKGVISTEDLNKQLNRGSHASGQDITLAQKKKAVESKKKQQDKTKRRAKRNGKMIGFHVVVMEQLSIDITNFLDIN